MKVKKFKIRPRLPSVGRVLKSLMGVKHLPPEIEESLPQESLNFIEHVSPLAFCQTWPKADIPVSFSDALHAAGFDNSIAVSALIATIGSTPEEYLSQTLLNGETNRSLIVTAFCEESADLSFHFLHRLLLEDAENEHCELSVPLYVGEPGLVHETLTLLEAEQEGITMDLALHLSPRFTRIALLAWKPIVKKRQRVLSQKKKSS